MGNEKDRHETRHMQRKMPNLLTADNQAGFARPFSFYSVDAKYGPLRFRSFYLLDAIVRSAVAHPFSHCEPNDKAISRSRKLYRCTVEPSHTSLPRGVPAPQLCKASPKIELAPRRIFSQNTPIESFQ
jgi:hypothetical protein